MSYAGDLFVSRIPAVLFDRRRDDVFAGVFANLVNRPEDSLLFAVFFARALFALLVSERQQHDLLQRLQKAVAEYDAVRGPTAEERRNIEIEPGMRVNSIRRYERESYDLPLAKERARAILAQVFCSPASQGRKTLRREMELLLMNGYTEAQKKCLDQLLQTGIAEHSEHAISVAAARFYRQLIDKFSALIEDHAAQVMRILRDRKAETIRIQQTVRQGEAPGEDERYRKDMCALYTQPEYWLILHGAMVAFRHMVQLMEQQNAQAEARAEAALSRAEQA